MDVTESRHHLCLWDTSECTRISDDCEGLHWSGFRVSIDDRVKNVL